MDHFAGLDASVKETSVCIVDDTSKIVREVKVASEIAMQEATLALCAALLVGSIGHRHVKNQFSVRAHSLNVGAWIIDRE